MADVIAHVAVRRERIVVTRHGRPLGAIVPLEDLERLKSLDASEDADREGRALSAYRTSWRRLTDSIHGRD